jgi:hypothetical protein
VILSRVRKNPLEFHGIALNYQAERGKLCLFRFRSTDGHRADTGAGPCLNASPTTS